MSYIQNGLNTYCPDTPQNRREFEQFCELINTKGPKSDLLSRQISRENKKLRSLRTFLPGREPDHY